MNGESIGIIIGVKEWLMKIPEKPPISGNTLSEMVRVWDGNLETLFNVNQGPKYKGTYIHWDDLRRRRMPEGITPEQMWAALKIHRKGAYNSTPLLDQNGGPFQFILPDPINETLRFMDMEAGGSILANDGATSSAKQQQYIISSLIEESITSSQIEGAATTRRVAKDMLQTGRKPRNHGEQMILNNYRTMHYIRTLKDEILTPEMVLDIHNRIAIDTMDESESGRLRTEDEPINIVENNSGKILYTPPPAAQLSERIKRLCDFANGKTPNYFLHPIIRSILVHFWLSYDHPFVDGNGRCARSLFYWSMLHHGYWLAEYISISRLIKRAQSKYSRAFLLTETDDNDLTYFILYHLELLKRSIDEVKKYIEDKAKETIQLTARFEGMKELKNRQRDLMRHALRNPGFEYTVRSHKQRQGVAEQTARADLYDLVDRGFLRPVKVGKTYSFYPVPDLESKLKAQSLLSG